MHEGEALRSAYLNAQEACIVDAHLIDGTGADPVDRAFIAINGGRITTVGPMTRFPTAVGKDVIRIDVAGRTVIPGLIDAHAHLVYGGYRRFDELNSVAAEVAAIHAATNAYTVLRAGYTTVRDLGTIGNVAVAIRDAIDLGRIPGPRVVASGRFVTSSRGPIQHPAVPWAGGMTVVADGVDAMVRAVREQVALGVDNIKLMASGIEAHPRVDTSVDTLTEDEIRAAVAEAHLAGRTVAVHAQSTAAAKSALRAGADTVEHGTRLDEEAVAMLATGRTVLVPTLSTLFSVIEYGERYDLLPKQREEMAANKPLWLQSFHAARGGGATIAAGGDVGNRYPHGANARELELLSEHGLPPLEALRAATGNAAIALRREQEIGTLTPGKCADLVVLESDPLANLGSLLDAQNIRLVVKGGQPVAGSLFDGVDLWRQPSPSGRSDSAGDRVE